MQYQVEDDSWEAIIDRLDTEEKAEKKKRGRPAGIPRNGQYGNGITTVTVRVPETMKDIVPALVRDLPELIEDYKARMKDTRDWTHARKLLEELENLLAH